jgi:hypothetical protein
MHEARVRHYIARAADFLAGVELMRNDNAYRNSVALLAIHSAVSYTDALRVGLGDLTLYADDHKKAVAALQAVLPAKIMPDQNGFQHLRYLLENKSIVAYGDERLVANRSEAIVLKAVRFAFWANKAGKYLQIGGWQHDDH